jgi:hypothetical protein
MKKQIIFLSNVIKLIENKNKFEQKNDKMIFKKINLYL